MSGGTWDLAVVHENQASFSLPLVFPGVSGARPNLFLISFDISSQKSQQVSY